MPIDPTNHQRAIRARIAVVAYRKAADTNETRDATLLCNLLTDLMHLSAACKGIDFLHSLECARANFEAEQLRSIICNSASA